MDKKKSSSKTGKHTVNWEMLSPLIMLIVAAILIGLALLLPKLFATMPELVEKYYSCGLYTEISVAVGWLSSLLPISCAEWIVVIIIAVVIVGAVVMFVIAMNRKFKSLRFFIRLCSFILTLAIFFNLFYLMWGFNYQRQTLAETMGLEVRQYSRDELLSLCEMLTDNAREYRSKVTENDDGVFQANNLTETFSRIRIGYTALGVSYPVFSKQFYPAKAVTFSRLMSYTGTAGMFIPYTMEANVNVDSPSLLIPASAAHENAHYYGYAREGEANFIAYMACVLSDDAEIAYSGTMLALIYAGNQLNSIDSDAYAALYGTYSEGMVRDLTSYSEYLKQFEGQVQKVAQGMNDSYLKHNDQELGVRSYGEVVDLLLAYYNREPIDSAHPESSQIPAE